MTGAMMNESTRVQRSSNPRSTRATARRGKDVTATDGDAKEAPRPRGASLRKFEPKAQMPTPSVLKRLSEEDITTLERIIAEPMECVFHASFPRANADKTLLKPLGEIDENEGVAFAGDPESPAPSSTKTLTAEEERQLFLCMNYCRYRGMRIIRETGKNRLTLKEARGLLRWHRDALKTRTHILQANLSLVPAMAKRSKSKSASDIADLICEGNLALLRSVDKFDCSRGFKFSTYACRAILSSFSSSSAKSARYRAYFPTEFDPALEKSDFLDRKRENDESTCVLELKGVLSSNQAGLSPVEQQVLEARFDLDRPFYIDGPPRVKTLKQVAELIGVTKERVRQIQNKAIDKLRMVMEEDILAA